MKGIIIALAVVLTSCATVKLSPKHKYEVVKAKRIGMIDGNDCYAISFESGFSDCFDFGVYSYYEVGDTVHFVKRKIGSWYDIEK